MRKEVIFCDKCGRTQDGITIWSDSIKHIAFRVPPDGINGGHFSMDLCWECRWQLWQILQRFQGKPGKD